MPEHRTRRRLAAIMAADVVGYSRLMEADEEGTLARLKALRAEAIDPKLAAYGGRVFKTTGDGMLAEFPSAVDAVRHAVDVQRAMAALNAALPESERMVFRIGISLGDVIVEGDDLFGNGVNVAARMEGLADAGGICISGNVQEHIRNTLDVGLEDLGEQTVKNIDHPVRCFRVRPERDEFAEPFAPPLPDKPSIAVLPFENMSGDPDQEYFADGIAEDIITALSRFRWFFVIARNSSFAYKGQSVDVKRVAKELGVQYVLEGSVRKAGNRVRITAQLIDANSGRHVWADRYDRELNDIFTVQDEITEAITGEVAPAFASAEVNRAGRKTQENLDAWDYVMRGNWHVWRCTREDVAQAKILFETAISRDGQSAVAFSGLAIACVQEIIQGWAKDPARDRETAYRAAKQAVALDDQDAWAHAVHGYIDHLLGDDDAALAKACKALELNPNLPFAEGVLGVTHAHLGRYDDAVLHAERAERLSPRDPAIVVWVVARAVAAFVTERYEDHLHWSRRLVEAVPDWPPSWRHLAVAYSYLNRPADAAEAIRKLNRLAPDGSLRAVREAQSHFQPRQLERFIDGLRKAGLPE